MYHFMTEFWRKNQKALMYDFWLNVFLAGLMGVTLLFVYAEEQIITGIGFSIGFVIMVIFGFVITAMFANLFVRPPEYEQADWTREKNVLEAFKDINRLDTADYAERHAQQIDAIPHEWVLNLGDLQKPPKRIHRALLFLGVSMGISCFLVALTYGVGNGEDLKDGLLVSFLLIIVFSFTALFFLYPTRQALFRYERNLKTLPQVDMRYTEFSKSTEQLKMDMSALPDGDYEIRLVPKNTPYYYERMGSGCVFAFNVVVAGLIAYLVRWDVDFTSILLMAGGVTVYSYLYNFRYGVTRNSVEDGTGLIVHKQMAPLKLNISNVSMRDYILEIDRKSD